MRRRRTSEPQAVDAAAASAAAGPSPDERDALLKRQLYSRDPAVRKRAWREIRRLQRRARGTRRSGPVQNPRSAGAHAEEEEEEGLDFGPDDEEEDDDYRVTEQGSPSESPDEGEASDEPPATGGDDEGQGALDEAPQEREQTPSGPEAYALQRIEQLQTQVAGLNQLLAEEVLNFEGYAVAVLPMHEALLAFHEQLCGEYPTTWGQDAAFLRSREQLRGQVDALALRVRRLRAPVVQQPGLATAIGSALPRPVGLDPATTAKHNLLKPPKFWEGAEADGSIRGWLTSVAHWLNMMTVPPADAVGTAANYLRGKAQAFWFSMVDTLREHGKDPTSWEVFKDTMVLNYGAIDPEYIARTKIDALRQTGTVETYVREMQMLFAELTQQPMHEADKVHKFFSGLNSGLAARSQTDPATGNRWTTFAAAARYAIRQDTLFQANKALNKSPKTPAAGDGKKGPGVDGKAMKRRGSKNGGGYRRGGSNGGGPSNGVGPSGAGKPSKAQREAWYKAGKCLNCGHPDHKKADCPKLKQN